MHEAISLERVMEAVQEDDNLGFCTACGDEVSGVEPDARHYKCPSCGYSNVFGAEELLFRLES